MKYAYDPLYMYMILSTQRHPDYFPKVVGVALD